MVYFAKWKIILVIAVCVLGLAYAAPNFVERQTAENRMFGQHIARHADLAVLIGPQQTRPIQEGLRAENFPEEQTKVFSSFFDAQAFLKSYLRPGDVVLYENDLPDQYNE